MTDRENGAARVVRAEALELLEERARIGGWLENLREFRDDSTPEVYEKVRSDYEHRLGDVNARLAEHRSDLESFLERHRSRVGKLQAGRDKAAANLEEAQLRFRVGEYGDRERERRQAESEAKIEALDADLGEEREALVSLEKVLGDLAGGRPSTPATPEQGAEEASRQGQARLVKAWGSGQRGLVAAPNESNGGDQPADEDTPCAGAMPGSEATRSGAEAADGSVGGEESSETEEIQEEAQAEYPDELGLLELLSLDDAERFDAESLMLDETEEEGGGEGPDRKAPRSPRQQYSVSSRDIAMSGTTPLILLPPDTRSFLTRPRGNRMWDAVIRGTGVLGLLGIGLALLFL